MLTILELIFCAVLLILIIQLCKRRCNETYRRHNPPEATIITTSPSDEDDLQRFRRQSIRNNNNQASARSYQNSTRNVEQRRILVRKNLFSKTISGEKSVLDLSKLLAIARGGEVEVDEEIGCDPCDEVKSKTEDELTLNSTQSSVSVSLARPSAPAAQASDANLTDAKDELTNEDQLETSATTATQKETKGSTHNILTNPTQVKLMYSEEKRIECSICLEYFESGDIIGWAKDGGDATSISNEARGDDTGCDHIFHEACLVSWLELHDDCPLCRRKVVHENADVRFAGWE